MNNDKNVRFLTKEEMTAVAGGHILSSGEDCGIEHITVSAPSYPPVSYSTWVSHQGTITYSGGGSIGGNIGVVEGSIGGNVTFTGTDVNNDGLIDDDNDRYDGYTKFMQEQGYAIN